MLTARLLAPVAFSFDGQPISLPNRKAQAILAYLLLNDAPGERRARLADLLWSESGPRNALTSLRQTLLELRRALHQVGCTQLATTYTHIELDRSAVHVDTADLLHSICHGGVPEILLSGEHLSDKLLAGFEDLDPELSEWLEAQRHAFQERLHAALMTRLGDAAEPGSSARPLAQAALLLDPTNEEACRLIMRHAAVAGDTPVALRAYDRLYRTLDADHDMEPGPETQALLAQIKLGAFDQRLTSPVPETDALPRVAVLPFRILGPYPIPTYVADGLVEDIVCTLARLREPEVISSNSSRTLRDADIDLTTAGRALGARYLVSGLIRTFGDKLRISVELAEAATGAVLWKQNHDTDAARLFEVHDHIVANIVHMLAPHINGAELRRIRRSEPGNLSAYHLMLQARELMFQMEQSSFNRAGALLERAIALEPEYANSHVTLSDWCSIRLGQGWSTDRSADAVTLDLAVRTALRHDPGNAVAMVMLGHNRTLLEHDYREALDLFDRATEAAPNDATVWAMSSPTYAFIGNAPEAIRRSERALSLSPKDPFAFRINHFLSLSHFFNGSLGDSEHFGRKSLKENPNYTSNLRMLACVLVEQGKTEEARNLAARAMQIQPEFRMGLAVAHHPSRDENRLRQYGNNLLAAGIPV